MVGVAERIQDSDIDHSEHMDLGQRVENDDTEIGIAEEDIRLTYTDIENVVKDFRDHANEREETRDNERYKGPFGKVKKFLNETRVGRWTKFAGKAVLGAGIVATSPLTFLTTLPLGRKILVDNAIEAGQSFMGGNLERNQLADKKIQQKMMEDALFGLEERNLNGELTDNEYFDAIEELVHEIKEIEKQIDEEQKAGDVRDRVQKKIRDIVAGPDIQVCKFLWNVGRGKERPTWENFKGYFTTKAESESGDEEAAHESLGSDDGQRAQSETAQAVQEVTNQEHAEQVGGVEVTREEEPVARSAEVANDPSQGSLDFSMSEDNSEQATGDGQFELDFDDDEPTKSEEQKNESKASKEVKDLLDEGEEAVDEEINQAIIRQMKKNIRKVIHSEMTPSELEEKFGTGEKPNKENCRKLLALPRNYNDENVVASRDAAMDLIKREQFDDPFEKEKADLLSEIICLL